MTAGNNPSKAQMQNYLTDGRKAMYVLLSSSRNILQYRSFLARQANENYRNIKAGDVDFQDAPNIAQERNLLRALSSQIISETISILEGIAAVSMSPHRPPEDRAESLVNYNTGEIYNFYNEINNRSLDYFKTVLCYPDVSDLGVDSKEEQAFEDWFDENATVVQEFFSVAADIWDQLKPPRNKITHGFNLYLYEYMQPTAAMESQFPDGADDLLVTLDWDGDNNELGGSAAFIGPGVNQTYVDIARQAVFFQNDIIYGLQSMIRNVGDPVCPEVGYGSATEPDVGIEYKLPELEGEFRGEFDPEYLKEKAELFDRIDQLEKDHGQPS